MREAVALRDAQLARLRDLPIAPRPPRGAAGMKRVGVVSAARVERDGLWVTIDLDDGTKVEATLELSCEGRVVTPAPSACCVGTVVYFE